MIKVNPSSEYDMTSWNHADDYLLLLCGILTNFTHQMVLPNIQYLGSKSVYANTTVELQIYPNHNSTESNNKNYNWRVCIQKGELIIDCVFNKFE